MTSSDYALHLNCGRSGVAAGLPIVDHARG